MHHEEPANAIDDHGAPGALSSPLSLPIKSGTPFLSSSPSSSLPSPYPSSLSLSHTPSSSAPSPFVPKPVETRWSSCSLSASPGRTPCLAPYSTEHYPSSTFIPAHEQEPKVEDNPKTLIYFVKHVLN
uniref:Uncharacterized protein n=1 Tax=Zea mays TaxID=4577 RepID=B4FUX1_MAIZE|nr:unknown [Zea mays]